MIVAELSMIGMKRYLTTSKLLLSLKYASPIRPEVHGWPWILPGLGVAAPPHEAVLVTQIKITSFLAPELGSGGLDLLQVELRGAGGIPGCLTA